MSRRAALGSILWFDWAVIVSPAARSVLSSRNASTSATAVSSRVSLAGLHPGVGELALVAEPLERPSHADRAIWIRAPTHQPGRQDRLAQQDRLVRRHGGVASSASLACHHPSVGELALVAEPLERPSHADRAIWIRAPTHQPGRQVRLVEQERLDLRHGGVAACAALAGLHPGVGELALVAEPLERPSHADRAIWIRAPTHQPGRQVRLAQQDSLDLRHGGVAACAALAGLHPGVDPVTRYGRTT